MELEWAEAEIRLLPGVYACGAAADGVVVFVDAVHDGAAIHDAVLAVLAILGISLPVRMLGGAASLPRLAPPRSPARVPAAAAAAAAAAILVAGTASALTSLTRGGTPRRNVAARPPATVPASPSVSTPSSRPALAGGPPVVVTPITTLSPAPTPTPAAADDSGAILVRIVRPTPRVPVALHLPKPPTPTPPTIPTPSTPPPTTPTPTPPVVAPRVVIASVAPPVIAPPAHRHEGDDDKAKKGDSGEHHATGGEGAGSCSASRSSPTSSGTGG